MPKRIGFQLEAQSDDVNGELFGTLPEFLSNHAALDCKVSATGEEVRSP
jgi:uncharacterized protein (DUF111 family)